MWFGRGDQERRTLRIHLKIVFAPSAAGLKGVELGREQCSEREDSCGEFVLVENAAETRRRFEALAYGAGSRAMALVESRTFTIISIPPARRRISSPSLPETESVFWAGGKPSSNGGTSSTPGVSRVRGERMGCGTCWDEACRENAAAVRGGLADARRPLAKSFDL
jgi:hypothetical protein